ncbi:MAG: ABC transporter ATP-binding protein [Parachlamydia sp.]|jgi:lipoprotein-releasing system ATP-binding protein|nr:ABC transporter ATP-binding protein [Parachlamydia sp.]
MSQVLEAIDIHKNFHHPACVNILKGVYLKAAKGESVAIIGRSGEGKSTLLQILGTLEQPCKGQIKINQQAATSANVTTLRNQAIGFVFQSFHLLEDYSALENVLMPARIARKNIARGSDAEKRAQALLGRVGLSERVHFKTKYLSGGEKQRVALARAMCNEPAIIFADEPSGNLDRQTAALIHEILLEFAHLENKTLILVTHDKELASLCSTRYELINGLLKSTI